MYIDNMNFYKITVYTVIFILIILLVYILYNYAKNKITHSIEPFYTDDKYNNVLPSNMDDTYMFFDIIETYNYEIMKYRWFEMPYYNDPVKIDMIVGSEDSYITEDYIIAIPDSYFQNNGTEREPGIGPYADKKNANGIFGRHVSDEEDKIAIDVNYLGASVILARPNVHRINLKNFILSKGNIAEFDLSTDELNTFKNTYDVLYKLNYWYSVNKTSFYENELIGNKLDVEKTGFHYVKYIYDPVNYTEEITNNIFFKNYVNKYTKFVNEHFNYDYYSMNNKMKLIYDIYNGDLSKMNLNYIEEYYPFETYKLDTKNKKPYSVYLKKLEIEEDWTSTNRENIFKVNVNSLARNIMENVIDKSITIYNSIFEDIGFSADKENNIENTLKDFFNNFFMLNALYSLYIDRYYYVDVDYYSNDPKSEKKTLSYENYKFIGGETFTLPHSDWLKGIGLNSTDNKAYEHITNNGMEFSDDIPKTEQDKNIMYHYYTGFKVEKVTVKNPYATGTAPVSKRYRGLTYVKAIDYIDGGKTRQKKIDDEQKAQDKLNNYRIAVETAKQKIKDIRKNISVRRYLSTLTYDDFVSSKIDERRTINDTAQGSDYRFDSFAASIRELFPPGLCRISDYANRDDTKDKQFASTNKGGSIALDIQYTTYTFTKIETNFLGIEVSRTTTVSPMYDWMGLGTGDETKNVTNKSLDDVAGKLFSNPTGFGPSGLGYDVQWYSDVINFAFTTEIAENIGRKLTDKNYKDKYDNDRTTLAKGQCSAFNGQTITDWRTYWQYYLNKPSENTNYAKLASSQVNVKDDKLLDNLLTTAYSDLINVQKTLTEQEKNVEELTDAKYYSDINDRYNKLYSQQIPDLLKSCAVNLNLNIEKINAFSTFINNVNDFRQMNYKWEKRLNECSINKIANIVYNSNSDTILINDNDNVFNKLNKEIVRIYHKHEDYTDTSYNVITINSLMPVMVYFEDTNIKNNQPGSVSVYNKNLDDYQIYNKTNLFSLVENIRNYINGGIFQMILDDTKNFLDSITKDYTNAKKDIQSLLKDLPNLIKQLSNSFSIIQKNRNKAKQDDYNKLYTSLSKIKNYIIDNQKKKNPKIIYFLNKYEKIISEIYNALSIGIDNKSVNLIELINNLNELSQKTDDKIEIGLDSEPLKSNLIKMFNLVDPYHRPNTMKTIFYSVYYNQLLKPKFFEKDNTILKRDVDSYSDIFSHPKILMTYNDNTADKTKDTAIFDLGIILRYIFDNDIIDYIGEKEKYNNYNFPTWFKYDSNNIINIDTNSDILSDDSFGKLAINSKINTFFDNIGEKYKMFTDKYNTVPYVSFPVNYFNFANEEKILYAEITETLDKIINNEYYDENFIKHSYTNNFTSSVNCLLTMYTDDLCNVIMPLFKQLKDMFDLIIDPAYNFDSDTFKNLKKNIENLNYLNDGDFKEVYNEYFVKLKDLNNGNVFIKDGKNAPANNEQSSTPGETNQNKDDVPGSLNYIFNIHNLLLNLILRAFYYNNRFNQLIKKFNRVILNDFSNDFTDIVSDDDNKYRLTEPFKINNCNISTEYAYTVSYYTFINGSLLLYKNKITKCCYNHLILNMANVAYDMEKKDHYLYRPNGDANVVPIQKGEALIKTVKIFENMLQTVKNGELYITDMNNKYQNITLIASIKDSNGKIFFKELNEDTSERGFWSIKSNAITNEGLDFYNPAFKRITNSINNYLNTVFYFGNAKLYGCFKGNFSNYYSSMGLAKEIKGDKLVNGDKPTLISYVNNIDTNGNVTKYGAITNCINNTIAHNSLININNTPGSTDANTTPGSSNIESTKVPFDLVSIVPYNTTQNEKNGSTIDTYACYAGNSSKFNDKKDVKPTINIKDMNTCAINYTDDNGVINPEYNNNLTNNTIIYKIDDSKNNDSEKVAFLGCYKKNIPELGVYGTLPNFIGTLSGSSFSKPTEIMNACKKLVDQYNDGMGTDYDVFGITTNPSDSFSLDCYAGSSQIDAKYAKYKKNDAYTENCNIYFPGTDNFIIFQDKDKVRNECLTKEVDNLQKYNDKLTKYLNSNITQQQKLIANIGMDINLLNNMIPVKFSVSGISNSKDFASIAINKEKSTGFDSNDSILRTCSLEIKVKEGPPGIKGDLGVSREKGKNTKGADGDIGNAGYWGKTNK